MFTKVFYKKQSLRKQDKKVILLFGVFIFITFLILNGNVASKQHNLAFGLELALPQKSYPYDRNDYQYGIDSDKDGLDTRAELLKSHSLIPVIYDEENNNRIISGKWFDAYTGVTFYKANDVDIDHLVPLYEVHLSGGYAWSNEKKRAYANDLSSNGALRVTHRWTNRVPKRADDPSEYTPSYVPGRCQYLYDWIAIKKKWNLTIDQGEAHAIERQMSACD